MYNVNYQNYRSEALDLIIYFYFIHHSDCWDYFNIYIYTYSIACDTRVCVFRGTDNLNSETRIIIIL